MAEYTESKISVWISQARLGNQAAFSRLFDFYFNRLRSYISPKLTSQDRHEGYDEDIAIDCMERLWQDLTEGRFEAVVHREDLWIAMMCIAHSKSIDRRRYHRAKKRFHVIITQMEFVSLCSPSYVFPSKELEFVEEWELFEESLPDDQYREIVRLKMEGLDVTDIATRLETTKRTVNRNLETTKGYWKAFAAR